MNAPAARTSYDTVRIDIGMMAIPVSVFSTTTETKTGSKMFTADGHPVGNMLYDKVTGEPVQRADVVSMLDTPAGPVALEPGEVERLLDLEPKTIKISAFYDADLAHALFLPKTYRTIEPAMVKQTKGKVPDPMATRQLSVLLRAMADTCTVGFGTFVTRNRPYPVVLHSDGTLWEVYHTSEIRAARPDTLLTDPPADLVASTTTMIESMRSTEMPDLTDQRHEAIAQYAAAKAAEVDPQVMADLVATLKASIERYRTDAAA
jgi:non-homologous end joining protein Ku